MTSHDHHPGSTDGHANRSPAAHLGDAAQRAAALMRQTRPANQTGRPGDPRQDTDASSARRARPRSRTAAQRITTAPECPARRPAPNLGGSLTVRQLPPLLRHTALVYGLARVRTNGTIGNRGTVEAPHWQHADRLDAELSRGSIILWLSPRSRIDAHRDLRLTILATARRSQDINSGDYVHLAAAPAILPPAAVRTKP